MHRLAIAVLLLACVNAQDSNVREVTLAQGTVRGSKDENFDIFAFYSIPYATAPRNEDRYKEPLAPPAWSGVLDATVDPGVMCPQFDQGDIIPDYLVMQEDCLIANIFVPNTEQTNLSVLVYVHGGAFQIGFGQMMRARNMLETYKDFIFVTFNYRLGVNGFLCLGTDDIPGNAGMKDQVALLRWVKENIASFGGNPEDVTLDGGSAGSAAVDLLMLSKSAEGLFNKVIPESGANVAAFSVQTDPLENAKQYARVLGFTDVDDVNALEHFFKTTSLEVLNSITFVDSTDATFGLSPCVEREESTNAFLTESPVSILKSGSYRKLPLLYGFANMEGLLRINFFELWKYRINEKFSDFLPSDLQFEDEDERERVAKEVKEFYFGDGEVDNDSVLQYVNFFSDVYFTYPALRAVRLHLEAGHNEVYLYEYSFVDEHAPFVPYTNVKGADHCAQSFAVFDGNGTQLEETDLSPEYLEIKRIGREMWHSFIKTGKPVPEGSNLATWPAALADGSPHMELNLPLQLQGRLLADRNDFWAKIYERHYREPIPPPQPSSATVIFNIWTISAMILFGLLNSCNLY